MQYSIPDPSPPLPCRNTMAPRTLQQNYMTMVVPLAAMYASQYIDSENLIVLWVTRVVFLAMLCGSLYVFMLVRRGIDAQDDTPQVTYYAASRKKKSKVKPITTSVKAYELTIFSKAITQLLLGAGLMIVVHWVFGAYNSLLIGCMTAPFTLFDNPLVKVYILGEDLSRPFTEPESLMQAVKADFVQMKQELSGSAPKPTAADAAELFRRNRGAADASKKR